MNKRCTKSNLKIDLRKNVKISTSLQCKFIVRDFTAMQLKMELNIIANIPARYIMRSEHDLINAMYSDRTVTTMAYISVLQWGI